MDLRRASWTFVALSCFARLIIAQTIGSSGVASQPALAEPVQTAQLDSLVFNGEESSFSVKEPAGWRGDTAAGTKYHVSIVFFPSNELSRAADVTIRVGVNRKVDEHIAAALAADVDRYRKEHPDIQFGELMIDHPTYATYSKLCFVPKRFYDYVSYINPGRDVPYVFSVTMSVAKRPANENERTALDAVARSLKAIDPNR